MIPSVSVIIPTYNSARWIRDTIGSVLSQAYEALEVVVADDGSSDDTVAICRSIDGPITVIEQSNQGRGSARNQGLRAARFDFLAFLDHDDLLLPGSIRERVAYFEANPLIDWVFTDAVEFDETGDLRLFLDQVPWLHMQCDPFAQLLRACYPLMSTVMMRRSLVERTGGFDPAYNYGDDLEYFMRLLLVSRVGMLRKPLTRRRIHPEQGVSSTFDRWHSRTVIYDGFLNAGHGVTLSQRRMVRRALKHARYKLGEWAWGELRRAEARRLFLRSLGINAWTPRAALYILLSHAPTSSLRLIRTLKRSARMRFSGRADVLASDAGGAG